MSKLILLPASCLFMVIMTMTPLGEAYPQRAYPQHLVYYPPPTQQPPRPILIRARRDTPVNVHAAVATNLAGGQDVTLEATKVISNDKATAFGTVFAKGNTAVGDPVRGITVGAASNGVSASVTKAQNSIAESLVKQAEANLRVDNLNSISAKVSQTDTKFKGVDFKPQQTSAGVSWKNDLGFGAAVNREINKDVSDILTKSVSVGYPINNKSVLGATFFESNVSNKNGFNFDKTGGILNYDHVNGYGASAGLTRFSGIGKQASFDAYKNFYTSSDGQTKLDANIGGSK